MAAESHKELQKTGSFGDWARKDIQYSQFQNYELTYAHFVRFPSWERWPPGLSPGVNWGLEPQCMMKSSSSSSQKNNSKPNTFFLMVIMLLLLVCHYPPPPPLSSNFKSNKVQQFQQKILSPSKNAKKHIIPNFIFPQCWIASLAISWLILAKFRQGIQNRLICFQWKSKISWWIITENNLMKKIIDNIIISIFPLSFHQYIGMSSTQKTSCDRPLDSTATPHLIIGIRRRSTFLTFLHILLPFSNGCLIPDEFLNTILWCLFNKFGTNIDPAHNVKSISRSYHYMVPDNTSNF